jgi:hypothetical protein
MRQLILAFAIFGLLNNVGLGQPAVGDYQSKVVFGNWSSIGSWETWNGTQWVAPAVVPCNNSGFAKTVTILSGNTINGNMVLQGAATATLIVNGTLSMINPIRGGSVQSSSFGNITINGTLSTNNYVNAYNFNILAGGIFITSYSLGTYWWYNSAGIPSVSLLGKIKLTGTSPQNIYPFTYSEVEVGNPVGCYMNVALSVTDSVIVDTGGFLDVVAGLITNHIYDKGTINAESSARIDAVTLDIFNPDGLSLQSDAYAIASFILTGTLNGATGATGTTQINVFESGGFWHYFSPPIDHIPATFFSALSIKNVLEYNEGLVVDNMDAGWVNYEGWHWNGSSWVQDQSAWGNLFAGYGYNFYNLDDITLQVSGNINNSDVTTTVFYNYNTQGPTLSQGFNLLGNPFTSGINWDLVTSDPRFPADVGYAINFWHGSSLVYYVGGVTSPDTVDARYIPPQQGFFIKSQNNFANLAIPKDARTHTLNLRYKSEELIPLVRLQIDGSDGYDQTVVRFNNDAKLSFDLKYDAQKMSGISNSLGLSSSLGGITYAINSIPFPSDSILIPLVINATVDGTYKLSAKTITGLETYNIFLIDNNLKNTVTLSPGATYNFSIAAGQTSDRFILKVVNITTAVPEIRTKPSAFNIFSSPGFINIQATGEAWNGLTGDIRIIDLSGRLINIFKNNQFYSGEIKQLPVSLNTGVYMVEITGAGKRYVGKVVIR